MISVTVYKEYNSLPVLDVKDLSFEEGKIYALIGGNGSGKSTFLKSMANVIKFQGKTDFGAVKPSEIGYLPQKNFAFDMSVKGNMMLNCGKRKKKDALREATELLEKFDLARYAKKNAARLSGGETQKLALCRLLFGNYKILLLDEPTASLDINSTLKAEENVQEYFSSRPVTLFMATHSLRQAKALADYVIYLENGHIEEITETEEFFRNPYSEKARLFLSFHTDF